MRTARIKATIPMLGVEDVAAEMPLYTALGFEIAWEHRLSPESPRIVSIRQGEGEIYLSEHPITPRGGIVYILTESLDSLITEASVLGFAPSFGPEDRPWGDREAYFTDSAGNVFRFGEPISKESEQESA